MVHLPLASFPIVIIYLFLRRGYRLVTVCVCFHEIDDEKPQKLEPPSVATISLNRIKRKKKAINSNNNCESVRYLHVYSWRGLPKVTQIKRWHRDQYASFGTNIVRLYSIKRHSVYIIARPPFLRCCITTTFFLHIPNREEKKREGSSSFNTTIISVLCQVMPFENAKNDTANIGEIESKSPPEQHVDLIRFQRIWAVSGGCRGYETQKSKEMEVVGGGSILSSFFFWLFGFSKGPRNLTVTPHTLNNYELGVK